MHGMLELTKAIDNVTIVAAAVRIGGAGALPIWNQIRAACATQQHTQQHTLQDGRKRTAESLY